MGATGDGKSLDTAAIQQAFDACWQGPAGGTVLFAAGELILSRPACCFAPRPGCSFEKKAQRCSLPTTRPTTKRTDKPNTFQSVPVSGEDLEDVTIAGRGVIDGAGRAMVGCLRRAAPAKRKRATRCRGRNLIVLTRVTNLVVRDLNAGRIRPSFHLVPNRVRRAVTVSGITILAPERSPNTDGIDPRHEPPVLTINRLHDRLWR